MLIAQRNLQMEDMFPVALKSEMARLNDTRVNRTDRDFVNLFAVDLIIIADSRLSRQWAKRRMKDEG
jgi:hypothetical protein